MTVSPGNLDSLLNTSYPETDFAGITIQSETGASQTSGTYSTVTLNTNGSLGWPALPGETLTVTAVDDTYNLIDLSGTIAATGSVYNALASVVGYSANSLLLTVDITTPFGSDLASEATFAPPFNTLDGDSSVLASSPIPAGTNLTFSETGSSNLTPTPTPTPTATPPWLAPAGTTNNFSVSDQSTTGSYAGGSWQSEGTPYSGPVAGLTSELIAVTTDNINVTATAPNVFISLDGGSGEDAIAVNSVNGNNVLNGSTGSSFLYGGTGNDTFFVDDRNPPAGSSIWSTVVGFHSGDAATIWGVTPGDFDLSWVDGQGAAGYTGLTLHATAPGVPTASLTLAGFTSADLTNGTLTVSFGTTAASGGVPGSTYMYVHGT